MPTAARGWRASDARRQAVEALASYGRMLTDQSLPGRRVVEREAQLKSVVEILCRMGRRNAIIVGHRHRQDGAGLRAGPAHSRGPRLDSSPAEGRGHLRVVPCLPPLRCFRGRAVRRTRQRAARGAARLPQHHPVRRRGHSLLQSGVHERTPFSDANEADQGRAGTQRDLLLHRCTSLAEYGGSSSRPRAVRRFALVHVDRRHAEATINILRARLDRLRAHYRPLGIPEAILPHVVDLTDDNVPALHQPDKSIQLIDAACAACTIAQPPAAEVTVEP